MPLTLYGWLYGVAQFAAGVLAIIAGGICLPLLLGSKSSHLRAWRPLTLALILFAIEEVIGGLREFGIIPYAGVGLFIIHVIVSAILGLMIVALVMQLQINKGWH